jgi:hypothetical protein
VKIIVYTITAISMAICIIGFIPIVAYLITAAETTYDKLPDGWLIPIAIYAAAGVAWMFCAIAIGTYYDKGSE